MAATIRDIARRTGLGIATVSKYLNGGHVLDRNRQAIEQAIRELDFHVNEFARGLKTNRSRTIGVVIPELSGVFCTGIITIMEDILRRSGYGILVCDCRTDPRREAESVEFLMGKRVDGIINMPVSRDGSHLRAPLAAGLPVVLFDRLIDRRDLSAVIVDNVRAAGQAAGMLLDAGHRAVGMICGEQGLFTTGQRLEGFRRAFSGRGLSGADSLVEYGDYTMEGGYESMKRLLHRREMSAVLVSNYDMTLGAVMALSEMGVRIPQDLSFIGFDNLELGQVAKPPLTIVCQPIRLIAEQTARLMLRSLKDGAARPETVVLPTSVRIGRSVAPRKG